MRLIPLPIVLFLLLAGCAGPLEETPTDGRFEAAGRGRPSWVAPTMSYDGTDARHVICVILIQADAETDTGQVRFDLEPDEMHGKNWDFVMDNFFGAEPWKEGGIRDEFDAHGTTGVGTAALPKVHVQQAGWGEVRVTVDDQVLKDPVTGEGTWLAEYEVVTTGIRDDQSGSIRTADQKRPFDPAKPEDAFANPNDAEIHFTMRAHAPPPQTPIPIEARSGSVQAAPAYNQTFPLFENPYFGSRAAFNITTQVNPVAGDRLVLRVLDPQGAEVWSNTADTLNEAFRVSLVLEKLGDYKLQVTGSIVYGEFEAVGELIPPKEVLLTFWWEDVIYDDAAVFEYENKRHDHGGTH